MSYPNSYMNLWLKAQGYTVEQVNDLPTVTYAVQILASWLGSTLATVWPPWTLYTFATLCCMFSTLCMIIWDIPIALKFLAWYLLGIAAMLSPILYSVVNQVCKDDSEERALIMGAMMTVGKRSQEER